MRGLRPTTSVRWRTSKQQPIGAVRRALAKEMDAQLLVVDLARLAAEPAADAGAPDAATKDAAMAVPGLGEGPLSLPRRHRGAPVLAYTRGSHHLTRNCCLRPAIGGRVAPAGQSLTSAVIGRQTPKTSWTRTGTRTTR